MSTNYGHNSGETGSLRLIDHIKKIEGLEEIKATVLLDINDAKQAAKFDGYDLQGLNQMLKERRMSAQERVHFQAICEVYRASLGMLNGTPLGQAARRAFEEDRAPPRAKRGEDVEPAGVVLPPEHEEGIEEARAKGVAAARAGEKIFSNPYVANDPRRAAFDEGYCSEIGHDGMELPAGLRRAEKKRGKKGRIE